MERVALTALVVRANAGRLPLPDSSVDLGWLAGVIDSESTVSLVAGRNGNPTLRISIYNSDDRLLDKCCRILRACDVPWSERIDARHERPGYALNISTAGCLDLYELVRPHMIRQTSRYDAGYWFMRSRGAGHGRIRWTDHDRAVWKNLREVLNAR